MSTKRNITINIIFSIYISIVISVNIRINININNSTNTEIINNFSIQCAKKVTLWKQGVKSGWSVYQVKFRSHSGESHSFILHLASGPRLSAYTLPYILCISIENMKKI
jgi:hypothetical protein